MFGSRLDMACQYDVAHVAGNGVKPFTQKGRHTLCKNQSALLFATNPM